SINRKQPSRPPKRVEGEPYECAGFSSWGPNQLTETTSEPVIAVTIIIGPSVRREPKTYATTPIQVRTQAPPISTGCQAHQWPRFAWDQIAPSRKATPVVKTAVLARWPPALRNATFLCV